MKRLFPLALAVVLLMCGCKKDSGPPGIGTIPVRPTYGEAVPQEPEPDLVPDNPLSDALVNNDRICVKIGEEWGFIDVNGNVIIDPCLSSPCKFNNGLLPANDNGLWGYLDPDGNWAVEPQFVIALPFSEGFATVGLMDENLTHPVYSIINHTGRTITKFNDGCGRGRPFNKGVAIVGWDNQLYAVVDRTGTKVFDTQFENYNGDESSGQFIFDGLMAVKSEGKWGFIDRAGEWIIKAQFEDSDYFHNRLCSVKKDGKWGVIDTTGKWVVEPKYEWYVRFNDGLASVDMDGGYGYINTKGETVIEGRFIVAHDFYNGVAQVLTGDGWGLIDKEGNWILEPTYQEMRDFTQGLAAVQIDDTNWGYIDTTGKLVISGFRCTTPFYEDGNAAVMTQDGKWTVIDDTGTPLFEATFDGVGNYDGYLDENGKLCQSTIGR